MLNVMIMGIKCLHFIRWIATLMSSSKEKRPFFSPLSKPKGGSGRRALSFAAELSGRPTLFLAASLQADERAR